MEAGNVTLAQLILRMEDRRELLVKKKEQRKLERENVVAENENADYLYDTFLQMKEQLQEKLDSSSSIEKDELKGHLDSLVNDVQAMQDVLNVSSMFLPSFQVKKAQEMTNDLNDQTQKCIQDLQPKKKFGFKSKNSVKPVKEVSTNVDKVDAAIKADKLSFLNSILEDKFFGFQDLEDKVLIKSADELENRQLTLQNLKNCKIFALGNPTSLQVSSLENCIVVVGPTPRSAFVKNCHNCKFVIACQQLRIHDTINTEFYLHVTSAAIIEKCKQVSFAPYNLVYPEIDDHYEKSLLDRSVNHWDQIKDFHWVNENKPSPNFTYIKESERKSNWMV